MKCQAEPRTAPPAAAGLEPLFPRGRLRREWKTVSIMLHDYCRHRHGTGRSGALCGECQALADYAVLRLQRCRFGAQKPTCANCPVHCYQPERREEMKAVMRFAGPRMLLRHPFLAVMHLVDGRRMVS